MKACRTCRYWAAQWEYRDPEATDRQGMPVAAPCTWAGPEELILDEYDHPRRPSVYADEGCRHHRRTWWPFVRLWWDDMMARIEMVWDDYKWRRAQKGE